MPRRLKATFCIITHLVWWACVRVKCPVGCKSIKRHQGHARDPRARGNAVIMSMAMAMLIHYVVLFGHGRHTVVAHLAMVAQAIPVRVETPGLSSPRVRNQQPWMVSVHLNTHCLMPLQLQTCSFDSCTDVNILHVTKHVTCWGCPTHLLRQ